MPNHVINEVRICKTSIDDMRGIAINDEGFVDFSLLLPIPLNYWQGHERTEHEKHFPGLGMKWSRDNWGTKWNAYGQDDNGAPTSVTQDGEDVILTFQTAWAFPRGWVSALFNKTGKDLKCAWFSEGGSAAHNEVFTVRSAGDFRSLSWDIYPIKDGSIEHKRLHKLLWGVEEFTVE